MDLILTLRDIAIVPLVAAFRIVPLDLLAERFFTTELDEGPSTSSSASSTMGACSAPSMPVRASRHLHTDKSKSASIALDVPRLFP